MSRLGEVSVQGRQGYSAGLDVPPRLALNTISSLRPLTIVADRPYYLSAHRSSN